MKNVGEILESPRFSGRLAEGRRLLFWRRTAESALAALETEWRGRICGVDAADDATLEIRVADAGTATRLRQIAPSFLAAFNRAAKTNMRELRARVRPRGGD